MCGPPVPLFAGCDGAGNNLDFYEKMGKYEDTRFGKSSTATGRGNCSSSSSWVDAKGAGCSDYHINAAAVRSTFDCDDTDKVSGYGTHWRPCYVFSYAFFVSCLPRSFSPFLSKTVVLLFELIQ